jgi:hypothetical protein
MKEMLYNIEYGMTLILIVFFVLWMWALLIAISVGSVVIISRTINNFLEDRLLDRGRLIYYEETQIV